MLQIKFLIICIIHKISVLLKITKILKTLFKKYNRLSFFNKPIFFFFSQHIVMASSILEEENIIKDV